MEWGRTIHCIGDLHAGGVKRPRVQAMLDDVKALPTPALHLQVGDSTENGLPEEDVLAKRWLGRLPARHYTLMGNHDVMHNKRTAKQWAAVHGYESQSYVIDFPTLRIVVVGPDRDYAAGAVGHAVRAHAEVDGGADPQRAGQDHLDRVPLAAEGHGARRRGTALHLGTCRASTPSPTTASGRCWPSTPTRRAWISGHTHSPIDAPGLLTRAKLPRGRKIVTVNCSAIVGVGKKRDATDPIRSLYLTHFPGRMEVRFRDHGERKWKHVGGRQVTHIKL